MCFCWFRDKKFKFKFAELLRLSIYGLFYIKAVDHVWLRSLEKYFFSREINVFNSKEPIDFVAVQ